jgi:hypothetical protein
MDDLSVGTRLGETAPLFPRIEQTVEELRNMSEQQPAARSGSPLQMERFHSMTS